MTRSRTVTTRDGVPFVVQDGSLRVGPARGLPAGAIAFSLHLVRDEYAMSTVDPFDPVSSDPHVEVARGLSPEQEAWLLSVLPHVESLDVREYIRRARREAYAARA